MVTQQCGTNVFVDANNQPYITVAVTYDPYQKNADGTYKVDGSGNKIAVETIGTEYKGATAFRDPDANAITDLVIPEGVISLASQAFMECTSLTRVKLPSTVTSLPNECFRGCTNLSEIDNSDCTIANIGR